MRIVVSGTHASGKSTLISDFALQHREYTVWADPFEFVDEDEVLGTTLFASQLHIAADRLTEESHLTHVIAERGPLDFLAYLIALADLNGTPLDADFLAQATARTTHALGTVDLLVVLPLTTSETIHVGSDEHLELRAAMNDILLDLSDDPDLVGEHARVADISGDPATRLAALEALAGFASSGDAGIRR